MVLSLKKKNDNPPQQYSHKERPEKKRREKRKIRTNFKVRLVDRF